MNKHGGYYGKLNLEDRSINVNPLGTPELLIEVIKREVEKLSPYPSPDAKKGREALATWLNLTKENLLLGNGAISLLYLYARAKSYKRVLLIDPSFNEYERAFRLSGSEVKRLILKPPFVPSVEEIVKKAEEEKVELVVLCNPCNPTGVYMGQQDCRVLFGQLKERGIDLFLDESFLDFVGEAALPPGKGLFQLRSLTKFYALAGLRLGYSISDKETISTMISMMEPWSVNHLAETVVLHLGELKDYEEKSLRLIKSERERMLKELKEHNLWYSETLTNFVLIRVEKEDFFATMKASGYYLRRCEDFCGLDSSYYRFSIGLAENNDGFLRALKESLCCTSS